jgi:hypothetical protein
VVNIDDPKITDEQAEAVLKCRKYRDELIAKYPGGKILKEEYLPIDDAKIHDPTEPSDHRWDGTTAGYLDFAIVSVDETEAELTDWKFGLWSVEPVETNLQGIAYLLGLFKRFPKLVKITVHFVMPHRGEIDFCTFTRDQFPALYLRVVTVVGRALEARKANDWKKCNATVPTCLFCANLGKCELAAAFALKISKKYQPVQVPENLEPSLVNDASQVTQGMEIAMLMVAWGTAYRKQVTEYAIENTDWVPENYTFRSRQDTKVVNAQAIEAAAKAAGVSDAQIAEARTLRMEPINKAVSDAHPRGQKKAALEAFREGLINEGALEKENPVYFLQRDKT